jgi:hypothetical protein
LWDSGLFILSLGALLLSILFAIHCAESGRAFWMGFALCGSGYLALSLIPSIESRLMTTKGLAYLDSNVPGRPLSIFTSHIPANQVQAVAFSPQGNQLATSRLGTLRLGDVVTGRLVGGWAGTTENFVRIGHSLLALLVARLGGLLSRRLWRASRVPAP